MMSKTSFPLDEWHMLREMNEARLTFIKEQVKTQECETPLIHKQVLDVGCGIGLLSEPLARMRGTVVGIDVDGDRIKTAQENAENMNLTISYEHQSLARHAQEKSHKYDLITALEVVEHVDNVSEFLNQLHGLLHDDGLVIISTINRTLLSYGVAIVGAEYISGIIPRGTHQWHRFITPRELDDGLRAAGFMVTARRGMMFHPLRRRFELSGSRLEINYIVAASKARR